MKISKEILESLKEALNVSSAFLLTIDKERALAIELKDSGALLIVIGL